MPDTNVVISDERQLVYNPTHLLSIASDLL